MTQPAAPPTQRNRDKIRALLGAVPPSIYGVILLGAVALVLAPNFFSLTFLLLMMRQAAPLGIVAIGQAFAIKNRSLDLSVGGIIGLTNVLLAARFWPDAITGEVKVALVLLCGIAIGLINGIMVARIRASAVVLTLGMGTILVGINFLISGGAPGNPLDPEIIAIGRGRIHNVPTSAVIWMTSAGLIAGILWATTYGAFLSLVGENESAAGYNGIPVERVFIISHAFSGFFAALAGVCLSGVIGVGSIGIGNDLVLSSIAAVILGGVVFGKNKGGMLGVAAGAFLLIMLTNLLNILGVGEAGKLFLQGALIVLAAGLYATQDKLGS